MDSNDTQKGKLAMFISNLESMKHKSSIYYNPRIQKGTKKVTPG